MGLDRQKIEEYLSQKLDRALFERLSIYLYDNIPSTNQILWELLDGAVPPPIAAIASRQTAGRGQWGRQWQSLSGGLYLSLAFSPDLPSTDAPHLTLLSAWGIADALRRHDIPVGLKWPNDLILQGRKLGGIKTEIRIQNEKIDRAVIGVGINWTNLVPEVGINLETFWQDKINRSINSLEMLGAIAIDGIFSGFQFYRSQGIENLIASYLQLLRSLGRTVTVEGSPGEIVGITSQGELRIRFSSAGSSSEICLPPGTISLGYDK